MSNPFDQFDPQPDIAGMVTAEAQRQGVDPALALRVAHQESGLNPQATSHAGAGGVMQLMPATAREMGVSDIYDPEQNIRGGVGYLKRQLDTFGDPRLAAAAYNAGPGRVRAAGGVPNIPETQDYVAKVAPGGNPFDQFDEATAPEAAPTQSAPAPGVTRFDGGHGVSVEVGADQSAPATAPAPSVAQDAGKGFLTGAAQAGSGLVDNALQSIVGVPLQMLGTAASLAQGRAPQSRPFNGYSQAVDPALYKPQTSVGRYAQSAGQMLPNAVTPGGLAKKAASVVLPAIGAQAANDLAEKAGASPTAAAAARFLGGALGSAATGLRVTRAEPASAARPLEQVKADSDQAWRAVDASGYRFPREDVKSAADDIRALVTDADPDLYENSAKVATKVERMAARGDLTPAQANRLRSQIGEKLLKPGSDEVSVGKAIQARIDQLIDGSAGSSPLLKDARAKYAQYVKLKDVTDRLADAGVNQAASGTGGNANAARQALKPLVKNKSAQRMRNASPDEMAALKNVVNGTPGQNLLRTASAFDPFHGKLGAMFQTGLGIKTGGLSLATIPLGVAATAGERSLAQRNIDQLLAILSTGGKAPAKAGLAYSPGLLDPFNVGVVQSLTRPIPAPAPAPRR